MNVCYFPSSVFMKMPYCIHVLEGQELLSLTFISEAKYRTKYKMLSVQQRERKKLGRGAFCPPAPAFLNSECTLLSWNCVHPLCFLSLHTQFNFCNFSKLVCLGHVWSASIWIVQDCKLLEVGTLSILIHSANGKAWAKCFARSWVIRNWNSRWKGWSSSWLNSLLCPGPPAIPQITANKRAHTMAQQEPRLKEK